MISSGAVFKRKSRCIHIYTPRTMSVSHHAFRKGCARSRSSSLQETQLSNKDAQTDSVHGHQLTDHRLYRDHERPGRVPRSRIPLQSRRWLQRHQKGSQQMFVRGKSEEECQEPRDWLAEATEDRVCMVKNG